MADVERTLAPAEVGRRLFVVAPDRDERASHLAMETLLTLWANRYVAPPTLDDLASPKRRNGAMRSLAVGANFLDGIDGEAAPDISLAMAGSLLARGADFLGSDGLGLVQQALQALVDNRTRQGSAGALLMQPFHESLLWYDARKSSTTSGSRWMVRKVNMRGTGVALARILLDPPAYLSADVAEVAREAVQGIKVALRAPSPFSQLSDVLSPLSGDDERSPEEDEREAWVSADEPTLRPLAERVIRHTRGIMRQGHISPAQRIVNLRNILALDLAHYALTRAWEATSTPEANRCLLLAYTPEARRENRVRLFSESSFKSARQRISQAIVATMATAMAEVATHKPPATSWEVYFEPRSRLASVVAGLDAEQGVANFHLHAERAFELAVGGGYDRPGDAFRVLIESIDLLVGTGQYRYLKATPELLSAVVGALSTELPLPAHDLLQRIWAEWNIIVGEAEAVGTLVIGQVDGSELRRNARYFESLLVDAGLAIALSDQTCMVVERRREAV